MARCSETEPTTNAHHLHRAPLLPLGGLDAALVERTGCSSMRKVGKLGERRAQGLGAVERLRLRDGSVVPIATELHAARLGCCYSVCFSIAMMHQKINATNRAAIALLRKCVPDLFQAEVKSDVPPLCHPCAAAAEQLRKSGEVRTDRADRGLNRVLS